MVTALGIDVRQAFTLVFALGGAAAALAGVLGGVYLGSVSPGQGTSLLIFAFIVVVIGGMGSIAGTAVAAVAGRAGAAVRELLPRQRDRRPVGGRCCWPRCCWSARGPDRKRRRHGDGQRDAGRSPRPGASRRPSLGPLVVLAVLLPLLDRCRVPGVLDGALNCPGTLQLLALCLVFGGIALSYDLLFGRTGLLSFGHALYFAAGTYAAASR